MTHRATQLSVPQHLPELDGLRAVAAVGIIVTHVSFQTGIGWGITERFDYFVAVFFALSAFLLWRRRGLHAPGEYFFSRVARLAPAYLACVCVVLALLPEAHTASPGQVLSNLTATQIYVKDGLAPGLTHLWSLCVEFSFYLVLPLLAWALAGRTRGQRIAVLVTAGILSLGWAFLPFVAEYDSDQVNSQIWPPAYTLWFVVGMVAAECEGHLPRWARKVFSWRWLWWLLAAGCVSLASREWFGPRGLVHPEPQEFAQRIVVGAVFGMCVVVPVALVPRETSLYAHPFVLGLGRWSYSLFLWHVAVLSLVFPLAGIPLFSGQVADFVLVLVLTVAGSVVVAAVSYVLIEAPGRRWIFQARQRRRAQPQQEIRVPRIRAAGPGRAGQHRACDSHEPSGQGGGGDGGPTHDGPGTQPGDKGLPAQ
nr:acyltransferase [Corynebacterium flavescens]